MKLIKSSALLIILLAIFSGGFAPPTSVEAQGFLPSIKITAAPGVDICNSTIFYLPINVEFDNVTRSYGDTVFVAAVGQVSSFQSSVTGPLSGSAVYGFNPGPYSVPANTLITITIYTYFDDAFTNVAWVSEIQFDCTDSSIVYLTNGPGNPQGPQPAPQINTISISAAQAQPVYSSAGGEIVRDAGGNELWLPQDYDGSGVDTHLVMSSTEIDGRTWYEIFIGNGASLVWVPADRVTIVE